MFVHVRTPGYMRTCPIVAHGLIGNEIRSLIVSGAIKIIMLCLYGLSN